MYGPKILFPLERNISAIVSMAILGIKHWEKQSSAAISFSQKSIQS